jgi:hypothetical protein
MIVIIRRRIITNKRLIVIITKKIVITIVMIIIMIKGSLGGETSVLRTFRMSGKELVKERVSEGKS